MTSSDDTKQIDLTKLSGSEIDGLMNRLHEARVERVIEEQAPLRSEYHDLMAKITATVEPYGLTGQKFLSMSRAQLQRHLLNHVRNQAAANLPGSGRRTAKVPPKYRHPDDQSLTWTGRGNRPVWVREWLAAGNSMDAVRIEKDAD